MFSIVIIFKGGLNTFKFSGALNGMSQQCSCWSLTKQREDAYRIFFNDVLPEMLSEDVIKGILYSVFKANYLIERKSTSGYYGFKLYPQEDFTINYV